MKKRRYKIFNHKGVTAVVVALLLTVIIGFVALAVDIGYMMMAKNELQNAADAAAIAAVDTLGQIYNNRIPPNSEGLLSGSDQTTVKQTAATIALANKAAGANVTIDYVTYPNDITIGSWNNANHYTACPSAANCVAPNAVQVIARRAASSNNAINTFFARIFGKNTMDVSATATAALTGTCQAQPTTPLVIAKGWFCENNQISPCVPKSSTTNNCNGTITLGGSTADTNCIAWTNFQSGQQPGDCKKGDQCVRTYIADPSQIPTLKADNIQVVSETNGKLSSALKDLSDLINAAGGSMNATVAVVDAPCSNNMSGAPKILGFTDITITSATTAGVNANMKCDVWTSKGSGCDNFWMPSLYGALVHN